MAKVAEFWHHFWIVLCLVLPAGMTWVNVLGAGYLVTFGYITQRGGHLLLKPVKSILWLLGCPIAYLALVVVCTPSCRCASCRIVLLSRLLFVFLA